MSDKRERFVALAEKRVLRAIHELRLIGNLANTHNYIYTQDDAQRIVAALEQEMKLLKGRFSSGVLKNQLPTFKL
jgi:hypothetical protein